MRATALRAEPDLVGHRVWVSWAYELDPLETVADVPDVVVRRKTRDFEFPAPGPGDPFLVYDAAAFPPAPVPDVLEVRDLPTREELEAGERVVTTAVSVAEVTAPGRRQESLRWTRAVTHGRTGRPRLVTFRLLDAAGLAERTPYYYELDDGGAPAAEDQDGYRAVAVPGGVHGTNRTLYDLVPDVYTRHDVRFLAPEHQVPGIPETAGSGGQLRRFTDLFGLGVDAIRSSAENLLDVHDGDGTQARFLAPLSSGIGWPLSERATIPRRRNELLSATRLFDVMGSVPALRAVVAQQTAWHSQVAELHQHVWRSADPPQRLVQAMVEVQPETWLGADDASTALGFSVGPVTGGVGVPAVLTTTVVEPFALRCGLELTLVVDDGVPTRVRFGPDDFADLGAATAAEIAAVVRRTTDTVDAAAVGGTVVLSTHAVGLGTSLEVARATTTVIGVDGAAQGRPAALVDPAGRLRLVAERQVVDHPRSRRTLTGRTWAYGTWIGDEPLRLPLGDPTRPGIAGLPDGTFALAWTDLDRPPAQRLRLALGTSAQPLPAVLTGDRRGPFALVVGTQVTLVGGFGAEVFTVNGADYVVAGQATVAEVVTAMNGQLGAVVAGEATGALRLSTTATGSDVGLRVDLTQSDAARALGLAARELSGTGSWDATPRWALPRAFPLASGQVDDAALCPDPLGGLRAFWAEHRRSAWEVRQAHTADRFTVVTAAGAAQRPEGGPWQTWLVADGLPSDDVRDVAVDAHGACWFATAAGLARRTADGVWTTVTTIDGLLSDDVRSVTVDLAGTVVCAGPAGLGLVDTAGAVTSLTSGGSGLVDDDVRAVTADPGGGFWAATPAGLSRLDADGLWRSWTVAEGLSAGVPREVALGTGGRVAVATSTGVSVLPGDALPWRTHTVADGLASDDVRGAAWSEAGHLLAATSSGLARWDGRTWSGESTATGLPTNDLLAVAVAPDGEVLLGAATGVVTGSPGAWTLEGAAAGLPTSAVVAVHAGWSGPIVLATGGGGHRRPAAAVDPAGRTWLVWERREGATARPDESWSVRLRRFDPAAGTAWEPEQAVTSPPVAGARDLEPTLEPAAAGFRVFFSSDRGGGRTLWWTVLDAAGVPGPLASLPPAAAESTGPAAVTGPDGRTWLFSRSDRSVCYGQVAMTPAEGHRPSVLVPDAGSLALRSGSRTVVLGHAARALGRHQWDDLLSYTIEHPGRLADADLLVPHLYTRRSIGLYLRQARHGKPITQARVEGLLQVLRRFLPINLRLVIVITPHPLVELVYTDGADLTDAYSDVVPLVELLDGLADGGADAMPDLAVFLATDTLSLTTSFADLTTARRRTWFPDLS